ncbi:conjugal transfer protein MobB [Phocaeicola vulgatus]|uniref:conjugal transfer protein MobB n=1 Tax=Phocaeicola vulgatus TaxID=821 RepID=UPI00189C7493|nr:conjugal transfer protein MobB [Phocaeicola vulgatus]MDB1018579.1 conjugal transfer protein MobB [Phocaeicola vulgatus]
MVAKITSGASVYGTLYYNYEKADKEKARTLAWNRVMERSDGTVGIAECMRSFEPYLAANRRTEKPVIHLSLNPHPDDILSDEQLELIGREYMEQLGYGNQPYVIFRHDDNSRPHIHIVSLRIDENGKKINDYREWERSMRICRSLEQKYGLKRSKKEERSVSSAMTPVDYRRGDLKHQIANVVKPAARGYRFSSFKEFKALLGLFNVTMEVVHKKIDGKVYNGVVYAAMDEKGKRTGVGIKSSDIDRSVGYDALRKTFLRNRERMKKFPVPGSTREAIRTAMLRESREGFVRELRDRGIVPVIWENDKGTIYGVTYVDHNSRTVFKGSAIGKEFSASVLNRLYGVLPVLEPSVKDLPEHENSNTETGLATGLLDIFSVESYPYPYENIHESPYGKKKKKRKRRGPHIG